MSDWKKVVPSNTPTWDRENTIEGEYIKLQQEVGPNESNLMTIRLKDGTEVGVWGSTTLDTKFVDIPLHSQIKIEPLGKVHSEKTGRDYLDFDVFYKEPEFKQAGVSTSTPSQSGYDKAKAQHDRLKHDDIDEDTPPDGPPLTDENDLGDSMKDDFLE